MKELDFSVDPQGKSSVHSNLWFIESMCLASLQKRSTTSHDSTKTTFTVQCYFSTEHKEDIEL
jgi:hypothetical protein